MDNNLWLVLAAATLTKLIFVCNNKHLSRFCEMMMIDFVPLPIIITEYKKIK